LVTAKLEYDYCLSLSNPLNCYDAFNYLINLNKYIKNSPSAQFKLIPQNQFIKTNQKNMYQRIAHITLVVEDYDEAIEFYTQKLDFQLLEDTKLSDEKRWVMIAPKGAKECCLLLAKAANERQTKSIGNQTGGRVGFFLFTDDFWRDYNKMKDRQINFVRPPETFEYGTVAIFEDLYGNLWDFIEPGEKNKGLNNEGKIEVLNL
jgi:catechol 2,3-dioxygenase-like lactoylglutathione lyase family enzyme